MKKVITLVLSLSMISASCSFFGSTGPKGILKSEDAGETYRTVNAVDPDGEISGLDINVMTMDKDNSDIIYVGSSDGIHKTDNAANSWKYILTGIRIGDIVIDPANSNIIYAAGISKNNGRVIKSLDGGSTWKDVYIEPTKSNPVLSVSVSISNSDVVLAGLNNGEIVRSTDAGASWQSVKDLGNPIIDIHYTDPGTVYAFTKGNGLQVSTDQGKTWQPLSSTIKAATNGAAYRTVLTQTYYDVAFDPKAPGTIYLATEQGLLATKDGGKTWGVISLPVSNQTLPVSAVAIDPSNSQNLLIAVGSTMFKTTNGGGTWDTRKLITEQRVRHIIIDPEATNNIYLGLGDK